MGTRAESAGSTTVDRQGRLVLPASIRRAAGIKPGDRLIPRVTDDGVIILETRSQIIDRIKRAFSRLKQPGVSVVDEFLSERRADARREVDEMDRWLAERIDQSPSS